jgi:DNA-directed RNA polymerase subunit RPC12/RpoP
MVMGEGVYWIESRDGRVECPRCHSLIDSEDFESYELVEVDGTCRGDIFSVTIKCMKCGAIIEVM